MGCKGSRVRIWAPTNKNRELREVAERRLFHWGHDWGHLRLDCETYVNDEFWKAVRKRPVTDPANPLTFKHFVGFNRFEQLPGSLPITVLRDDGTRPAEPVTQFGPGRPLKVHPAWVERSVTFLAGNEFAGFGEQRLFELRSSEHM